MGAQWLSNLIVLTNLFDSLAFIKTYKNYLREIVAPTNLDNILHHWRFCTRANILSWVFLPTRTLNPHEPVTKVGGQIIMRITLRNLYKS